MGKKKTILITAVAGDIGMSAVRALHGPNLRIIGCDMRPQTAVASMLDAFLLAPRASNEKEYVAFLEDAVQERNVDIILPISEPEIEVVGRNRRQLEAFGVKLMINNPTIIETFLDKYDTNRFLQRIGLQVPQTELLEAFDHQFPYPAIAKPRKGCGSKRQWRIDDDDDLKYVRMKGGAGLVVQEYVGTAEEEYTTGIFSDGQNTVSITFRRVLGLGGLSVEAELANDPRVSEMAELIAQKTGLVGCINLQTRKCGIAYLPFEINPRLSSTLLFRKEFGFDDARWWMDAFQGGVFHYEQSYSSGKAIRYLQESYFDMKKVRHG